MWDKEELHDFDSDNEYSTLAVLAIAGIAIVILLMMVS